MQSQTVMYEMILTSTETHCKKYIHFAVNEYSHLGDDGPIGASTPKQSEIKIGNL